ncbi:hypothetical protein [Streptomyces sp. 2224.1]|uniref:hypothetical protein n=1 Tax=Streptomyces sp. 2224.1 TaxID=1881020 RepID=UPI001160DF29|nr:hypothetical protein [Streptomyces sp. 2224.1]
MVLADETLHAILAELRDAVDWSNSLCLDPLLAAVQGTGVVDGAEAHQLLSGDGEADEFLLSLRICGGVMLCSLPVSWEEVRPAPTLTNAGSARHVLNHLAEIAEQLRADLASYSWHRVSMELAEVRGLIQGSGTATSETKLDAEGANETKI